MVQFTVFSVFRVEFWLEYAEVKLGQNTINSTPHRLALDSSQSWAAQFFRVFVFSPLFVGLLRVWEFFAAEDVRALVNETFLCYVKKKVWKKIIILF